MLITKINQTPESLKANAFVQYMTDVKGYSAREAYDKYKDIGGALEEVLSDSEITEMCEFSGIDRKTF